MATNSISLYQQPSQREPLAGAYMWLMLFMVVYCARPQEWIPKIGAYIPMGKVTGILAFLALTFAAGKIRQRLPREVIYLGLLIVQLWLTVPMSSVWRGGAFDNVLEFSKVLPIVIVISLAVRTATRLRRILLLQCMSVAIISSYALWKGHSSAGRLGLEGIVGGNYANPNDLAFSIVMTLPLCLVFFLKTRNMLMKVFWLAAMPVMMYAMLLTGSRGGVVCLLVAAALCLWEFGVRGRRHHLLLVVPVAAIVFWAYAGGVVKGRFQSTFQNTDDQAYSSAQERWHLLVRSVEVTAEHPVFGVGPGNFVVVSGFWRMSHNSFTQMSSEGGLPGFVLFVMLLWCGFKNIKLAKQSTKDKETALLASGLQASLLAFVVGSFFDAAAYQLFTYFLVAYTTALCQITLRQEESGARLTESLSPATVQEDIVKNPVRGRADLQWNGRSPAVLASEHHSNGTVQIGKYVRESVSLPAKRVGEDPGGRIRSVRSSVAPGQPGTR